MPKVTRKERDDVIKGYWGTQWAALQEWSANGCEGPRPDPQHEYTLAVILCTMPGCKCTFMAHKPIKSVAPKAMPAIERAIIALEHQILDELAAHCEAEHPGLALCCPLGACDHKETPDFRAHVEADHPRDKRWHEK